MTVDRVSLFTFNLFAFLMLISLIMIIPLVYLYLRSHISIILPPDNVSEKPWIHHPAHPLNSPVPEYLRSLISITLLLLDYLYLRSLISITLILLLFTCIWAALYSSSCSSFLSKASLAAMVPRAAIWAVYKKQEFKNVHMFASYRIWYRLCAR